MMRNQLTKSSRGIGFADRVSLAFKALTFRFPAAGGQGYGEYGPWGWLQNLLPGSRYDYKSEAGNLWQNSIVLACLKWQARVFPEAPFCVKRPTEGNQSEIIPNHPLTKLLKKPNPFYSGSVLWQATLLSLAVDGNAYWFAVRSAAGKIVQLWWIPHWMISPRWDVDGVDYLADYRYRVNGQDYIYPAENIIHFRDGLDPLNPRKGLSALSAALREVCTDNERAGYNASILRNMGVPGVIIRPPTPRDGQGRTVISELSAKTIAATWRQKFGNGNQGEPLVLDTPLEITPTGFSPRDLEISFMSRLPEERICAALGIAAVTVGMGAGLAQASAKASHENSTRQSYEGNIIPTQRMVCEELDLQALLDTGGQGNEFCAFDLSNVRYLQEDEDDLYDRLTTAYVGGWIKRGEARARTGYAVTPEDDVYCPTPSLAKIVTTSNSEQTKG